MFMYWVITAVSERYNFGVRKVDYFHGLIDGVAICQMSDNEEDVFATEMINISKGYTAVQIIHLQRRWRRWLLQR